ncbi:flagellar motor stator protein MotA [Sulfitobacter aestuarii]|uniref:Flagellar motor stator protein MotA n=1 Tax=Sulfitobacter aestuarii TaxID=2161676 RepID=A0ABW5U3S0_9RHOB
MMILLGLVVVLGMVFGGYTLSGGYFDVILHALPYEGMMISGAAIGAFVIANSGATLKATGGAIKRAFSGPRWKSTDHRDLLSLLFELTRLYRTQGPVALEGHIENPHESNIFKQYPRILNDKGSVDIIVDSYRMVTMNFDDPHQMEDVIEKKIEARLHENLLPAHALHAVADGLPAIGIVAAVLGVIKTMSAVDQPPVILGTMIGGALVGTFLGVFLAYCAVAPLVGKIQFIEEHDHCFSQVIRDVVVAMTHGHSPNLCVEIGRGNIPPSIRPSFAETEEALRALQVEG